MTNTTIHNIGKRKQLKFSKKNLCLFFIWIQDYGDVSSNAAATKAVKQFGMMKLHKKLTGNPASAYKFQN